MTALAVPHVVEQIGSYAGFAAVVGLAVLSALYISQARDLRRLREWAGRAPERAAEQAARGVPQPLPGRAVTPRPAQPAKPGAAVPATPGAGTAAAATGASRPAAAGATPGAQAATAGAAPGAQAAAAGGATTPAAAATGGATTPAAAATGGAMTPAAAATGGAPPAATPAGAATAAAAAGEDETKPAADDGAPPEVAPVPVATGGAKEEAPDEPTAADDEAAASNGAPPESSDAPTPSPPPQRAPRPATSLPRRSAPLPSSRPAQTAIPPRPASKRAGGRRGPDPRYIALAVVGVLVVGAGAAVGVPKLLEEDDSPPAQREAAQGGSTPRTPVAPEEITVSVLNGTTVPGLAAQVGDQVENEGFVLGNVTNAAEQQRSDSIVMYAPGHTRDARLVARRLRLSRNVEPVDPDSQGLAGDATVVVVVGQDQTR